jgi:hypothetical protein
MKLDRFVFNSLLSVGFYQEKSKIQKICRFHVGNLKLRYMKERHERMII